MSDNPRCKQNSFKYCLASSDPTYVFEGIGTSTRGRATPEQRPPPGKFANNRSTDRRSNVRRIMVLHNFLAKNLETELLEYHLGTGTAKPFFNKCRIGTKNFLRRRLGIGSKYKLMGPPLSIASNSDCGRSVGYRDRPK